MSDIKLHMKIVGSQCRIVGPTIFLILNKYGASIINVESRLKRLITLWFKTM